MEEEEEEKEDDPDTTSQKERKNTTENLVRPAHMSCFYMLQSVIA